jgi:nucleoside-diphosphate-sugar epimerase
MSVGETALVTGASGFVGRHLVRLLLERGARVRALVRAGDPELASKGVSLIRGDVGEHTALRDATRGADVVYHLAGRAHILREEAADPLRAFRRVNVEGTRALVYAAAAAGVQRFVFVSSAGAVCTHAETVVSDLTPARPNGPYGMSKLEAEVVVAELGARLGIATISIRPSMIYGPGQRGNPQRLFDLVASRLPLPLGGVHNRRSLMYVGNLVHALAVAAPLATTRGESYLVSDSEVVSTPELVRHIAVALDSSILLIPMPDWIGRSAATALGWLGRRTSLPVTGEEWDRLASSLEIDSSRFYHDASFVPPCTLSEGLAETARWYRDRKGRGPRS